MANLKTGSIKVLLRGLQTGIILEVKSKKAMATIQLDAAGFKDKVFNYETEQEWKYAGSVPAIVDFYADWCGPCKAIAPILDELATELDGKVKITKVNVDDNDGIAAEYGVRAIPTMLLFKGGVLVETIVGMTPKATLKEKLLAKI